jgi:2-oxoisovalerate dehydrogenase E1 component
LLTNFKLKKNDLKKAYSESVLRAIKIRFFEKKLLELYSQGHLNGTVHTCIGQELTPSYLVESLIEGDVIFSNHRGHGHYLSWTNDYIGLMNEIIGNKIGCSSGIGGSQHLFFKDKFYSNGIQAGMTPVAAGFSFIQKQKSNKNISVIFIGDGTLGEGLLYETLNFVSLKKLPILFVLENNGIAQSTSFEQTFSGSIKSRVEGFGLNYLNTSTFDLDDMSENLSNAVSLARNNSPCLIEVKISRLMSHSKGDDNRSEALIAQQWDKDLLEKFIKGDFKDQSKIIEKEINEISEKALKESRLGSDDKSPSKLDDLKIEFNKILFNHIYHKMRYNELIRKGISLVLKNDGYFIGEDIEDFNSFNPKSYGGAFKVSGDLSTKFEGQVMNFPISEALIAGFANGVSLSGVQCVCEIMFGDFTTLVLDQLIQHTSKFKKMYGREIYLPFILRTPMGGGRGYGPTHSQSFESMFLGIPNIQVIYLNNYIDPIKIYEHLISNQEDPIVIFENKLDYSKKFRDKKIVSHDFFISNETFPTIVINSKVSEVDFTIITYGGGLSLAIDVSQELAINHDIYCNTVCYTNLSKPNISILDKELMKSKNIILLEEGQNYNSFGSAVLKILSENKISFNLLHSFGNNEIIPSSFIAEQNLLPSVKKIVNTIIKL